MLVWASGKADRTQRDSLTSNTDSSWPRPQGFQHKITISVGTDIGASEDEMDMAQRLVREAPALIDIGSQSVQMVPNAAEDFHDPDIQVRLRTCSE